MSDSDNFNFEDEVEGGYDGQDKEPIISNDERVGEFETEVSPEEGGDTGRKKEDGETSEKEEETSEDDVEEEVEKETEGQEEVEDGEEGGSEDEEGEQEPEEDHNVDPPQTLVKKRNMEGGKDPRARKYLGGRVNSNY